MSIGKHGGWVISAQPPHPLHGLLTIALEDGSIRRSKTIADSGETIDMNGRTVAGILLALLLIGGAAAIGITAYNAGVTAGLVESGQVVVGPGQATGPYVGGYGPGWGNGGFGFFGFLGFLFFLFLFFALIRAAFGGWGRRGGWGGGGPGWGGRYDRIREMHDELHRSGSTGTGTTSPNPTDQPRS
jgi:hypothetical protein